MRLEDGEKKPIFIRRFKSIRTTILLSYMLVVVVSVAVFAMVALNYTEKTVLENAEEYSTQLINKVNRDIDSYVEYLRNTSILISSNTDVHDYLFETEKDTGETAQAVERIIAQFQTIMDTRSDIVNIGIIGDNGRYLMNQGTLKINENIALDEVGWIQDARNSQGVTTISSSHVQNVVDGRYEWVVTLSRGLKNKLTHEVEGVFFVDLNYSSISELCDAISFGNRGYVYILDEQGNLIYHPQQQLLYSGLKNEKITEVLSIEENSFVTEDGKLYCVSKSEETGWTVVGVAYVSELLKNSTETGRIYVISAILIMLAAMILAAVLSREITKPIKRLSNSMREVEKGNFENVMLDVQGENEIDRLSANFNMMTTEIKHLMEQNVADQRQKRKSELMALQAQINPHFLYNTLDSIIWMAEWGKNKEVVLMTSSLAKLLRQSISNQNELVRVEDEVAYTTSYLTIQKMRYKDKLEYEILVEPEILNCKVAKLILQPLVENAIYHGIKYKEGKGKVLVEGFLRDEELILRITDDGIGMSEEKMAHLFEKRETDRRKNSVGVLNVHERIRLYYGKDYGLTFESTEGEGTKVEIHIPYEKGQTGDAYGNEV